MGPGTDTVPLRTSEPVATTSYVLVKVNVDGLTPEPTHGTGAAAPAAAPVPGGYLTLSHPPFGGG